MPGLVERDPAHHAADGGILRGARLPHADEGAERLAHAPLDGIVERDGLERARGLFLHAGSAESAAVTGGEPAHHARVPDLVAPRDMSAVDERFWRAVVDELRGEGLEGVHARGLEVRDAREIGAGAGRAAGLAMREPRGAPADTSAGLRLDDLGFHFRDGAVRIDAESVQRALDRIADRGVFRAEDLEARARGPHAALVWIVAGHAIPRERRGEHGLAFGVDGANQGEDRLFRIEHRDRVAGVRDENVARAKIDAVAQPEALRGGGGGERGLAGGHVARGAALVPEGIDHARLGHPALANLDDLHVIDLLGGPQVREVTRTVNGPANEGLEAVGVDSAGDGGGRDRQSKDVTQNFSDVIRPGHGHLAPRHGKTRSRRGYAAFRRGRPKIPWHPCPFRARTTGTKWQSGRNRALGTEWGHGEGMGSVG